MHKKTWAYLQSIGADERALPETPEDLLPYACYVPDNGYCVVVIPEQFADPTGKWAGGSPEDYEVPVPTRYVLERGYRVEDGHVYCDVPYEDGIGTVVPESYCVYADAGVPGANYVTLAVGQPFAPMVGQSEGARFGLDASGAIICVGLCSPTAKEIEAFAVNKPLRVGLFYRDDVMFMLFRFGDLPWMDAPYSPHLSPANPIQYIPDGQGLAMTCILTDVPSGVIKQNIRAVGLSTMFTRQFSMVARDVLAQPFDPAAYNRAIARLMRQYSTRDMVAGAIATCLVE